MTRRRTNPLEVGGDLALQFMRDGTAVLFEGDEPVWSSDADDEFREDGFDEFLSAQEDAGAILEYLEEHEYITDEEIGDVIVEVEEDEKDDEKDSGDPDVIETETRDGIHYKPVH